MAFNSTCCSIDPETIPVETRNNWCDLEQEVCGTICRALLPGTATYCDAGDLKSECMCGDRSEPDTSQYIGSLGAFKCEAWKKACIANKGAANQECNVQCGSKTPVPIRPSTTSSSTGQSSTITTSSTTSPVSSGGAVTSGTNAEQTNGPSSTNSHASEPSSSGLSVGAKAGMAVGASLLFVLAIVSIFFVLRRRRNLKASSKASSHKAYSHIDTKSDKPRDSDASGLEVDPTNGGAEAAFLSSKSVIPNTMELDAGQDQSSMRNAGMSPISPMYHDAVQDHHHHPAAPAVHELPNNASPYQQAWELDSSSGYHGTYPSHELPAPHYQPWTNLNNSAPAELPQYSSPPSVSVSPVQVQPVTGNRDETTGTQPTMANENADAWPLSAHSRSQESSPSQPLASRNDVEQLEEDERRINEEIAAIEQLRKLQSEREALRERIKQAKAL